MALASQAEPEEETGWRSLWTRARRSQHALPGRVTSRCLSLHGGLIIHSDGAEPADGGTQTCSGAVISSPAVNKSKGEAKKPKQNNF